MHLEEPSRFGPYRAMRFLAATPVAVRLLGTDARGRAVVLTAVRPEVAGAAGFRQRFLEEVRSTVLAAPEWFVPAVIDVDPAADPPYLVTAYVPGSTLQARVEERGPLPRAGTAALAAGMAGGLAAMHANGLLHGDITPSSILLTEDGPRLAGPGLAYVAGPGRGTAGFQAPEQVAVSHGFLNAAVDLFALGCVLGFAATGRSPFAAGSVAATLRRVAEAEPDLGAMAGPVRAVVLACLHKDPAQRPIAARAAAMLDVDQR